MIGGNADFLIDRTGAWYYRGTRIEREAMVRMFARMLRRAGEQYFLATPEQKVSVVVEDAPFVVTDMETGEERGSAQILFRTNVSEIYLLGREHPLWLRAAPERKEVRAYLSTRDDMPALVHRNVFYRLAELSEIDPATGKASVLSDGTWFALE